MPFNTKKNNFDTLKLYFNVIINGVKPKRKNFLVANILMIIVAVTSLYPIAIDFAFNAINNNDLTKIFYIPVFIILLTLIKGFPILSNNFCGKNK